MGTDNKPKNPPPTKPQKPINDDNKCCCYMCKPAKDCRVEELRIKLEFLASFNCGTCDNNDDKFWFCEECCKYQVKDIAKQALELIKE